MKNIKINFGVAILMIVMTASFGGRTSNAKTTDGNDAASRDVSTSAQEQKMDIVAFSKLVQDIFLKLPKEVLPAYAFETPEMRHPLGKDEMRGDEDDFNCRRLNDEWKSVTGDDVEFTARWTWNMAAYLTDDNQNAVVIIHYRDYTKHDESELTDHTLNYHIPSGVFTHIERDEDPMNLIEKLGADNEKAVDLVKGFYYSPNYADYVSYIWTVSGYQVYVDLLQYWNDTRSEDDRSLSDVVDQFAFQYKWNGKRFVKQ